MKNTQQLADRARSAVSAVRARKEGVQGRKTGFVTLSAFSPAVFSQLFKANKQKIIQ